MCVRVVRPGVGGGEIAWLLDYRCRAYAVPLQRGCAPGMRAMVDMIEVAKLNAFFESANSLANVFMS